MFHLSRSGGDNRDMQRIGQGSQSVVRVSVFYAIVRHTGEKDLAGATAFRFRGPLKQILIRRDTPSV